MTRDVGVTSLLVTNDFPPKIGGIQSYLFELWRRLPPSETTVFTTNYADDKGWDAVRRFRVVRAHESQFFPTRSLANRIDALAREVGADVIFLDPWLPLGQLGAAAARRALRRRRARCGGDGARTVARVARARRARVARCRRCRSGERLLGARGGAVRRGARCRVWSSRRASTSIASGPSTPPSACAVRRAFGLDEERPLVVGMSRLVPRKGFDVLIDAVAGCPTCSSRSPVVGATAGGSRRGPRSAGSGRRVRFLGRVPDGALAPLLACADVFAMPCRDRWLGLEAEGFGIVFLEAAAAGVPAVAGRSGGSHEAVVDGSTGFVVDGRSAARGSGRDRQARSTTPSSARGWGTLPACERCRSSPTTSSSRASRPWPPVDLSGFATAHVTTPAPDRRPSAGRAAGRPIVIAGWIANVVFAVTAIPAAIIGEDAIVAVAIAVALAALLRRHRRLRVRVRGGGRRAAPEATTSPSPTSSSSRVRHPDACGVTSSCCSSCAWRSLIGTAAWEPFGVLVPMLPIGLAGVWAARHGKFPPRPPATPRRRV